MSSIVHKNWPNYQKNQRQVQVIFLSGLLLSLLHPFAIETSKIEVNGKYKLLKTSAVICAA